MSQINRRDFIKGGALAAGVLATGGAVNAAATRSLRLVDGKLNIGVIGVGGKGWSDWNPMLDYGENIVALCDADRNQIARGLEEIKKKRGDAAVASVRTYTDYRRMLDDVKALGMNAVTVSTPDHIHGAAAISAMRLGCHAYVQKPLVRTIAEARWFARAAIENRVVTQMGNQGSANSGLRRSVELLNKGVLGRVREVHVWTNRPVWPQGRARPAGTDVVPEHLDWEAWIGVAPARPYKKDVYHTFKWRGFFDFGTGAFGDMACHTMNLPFRGLQLKTVTEAICTRIVDSSDDMYPGQSIVELTYAARKDSFGNQLEPVRLVWYDGDKLKPSADMMPQVVATFGSVPRTGSLIIGDKGIMVSTNDYGAEAYMALKGEEKVRSTSKHEAASEEVIPPWLPRASHGNHYNEFVDACKGKVCAYADIDHSVPIMESMLVGCIAQRIPNTKLPWNYKTLSFSHNAANALIKPYVRQGWGGWEYK